MFGSGAMIQTEEAKAATAAISAIKNYLSLALSAEGLRHELYLFSIFFLQK
jgi:hypothetical protein